MMMMDIKNYYLGTPLPQFEYMKMLLSRFPEEIIDKYNLNALAVDGWVYIEIRKGMYGNALLKTYELTTDWSETVYSGMTLKWDYNNRTCDISMPTDQYRPRGNTRRHSTGWLARMRRCKFWLNRRQEQW
jgi:hypothetical protein